MLFTFKKLFNILHAGIQQIHQSSAVLYQVLNKQVPVPVAVLEAQVPVPVPVPVVQVPVEVPVLS